MIHFGIGIRIDMSELEGWTAAQIKALLDGIAEVMAAATDQGEGD